MWHNMKRLKHSSDLSFLHSLFNNICQWLLYDFTVQKFSLRSGHLTLNNSIWYCTISMNGVYFWDACLILFDCRVICVASVLVICVTSVLVICITSVLVICVASVLVICVTSVLLICITSVLVICVTPVLAICVHICASDLLSMFLDP